MEVHLPGRRRPRIGWIVAGLAIVPLLGLVSFAVREIRVVLQDRADTRAVVETADRSVTLVHLAAAIDDEKYWTYVHDALTELNIDPAILGPLVGIDVVEEHESARRQVERWLEDLGSAEIRAQVEQAREGDHADLDSRTAAFEPIEEDLELLFQLEIDALLRNAALLPDSDQLVDSARVLEAAAAVRNDMAWKLGGLFGSRFDLVRSSDEYLRILVERSARYEAHMAQLTRLAPTDSEVAGLIGDLEANSDVRQFLSDTQQQIDLTLSGEIEAGEFDITTALQDPTSIAAMFIAAVNATEAHLPLVNAAAEDITREARQIHDAANSLLVRAAIFW